MKKWINTGLIAASPIVILALLAGIWTFIISPALSDFIKAQLPKINSSQDLVTVYFEQAEVSLLKLQLVFRKAVIEFKNEKFTFEPISSEKILVQIDPFKLLIGQIESSHIVLDGTSWQLDESQLPKSKNNEDLHLDTIFKVLPDIPVRRLILKNTDFAFNSKKNNVAAQIDSGLLIISNLKKSLAASLEETNILVQNQKHPAVPIQISAIVQLDQQQLKINNFIVQTGQSNFEIQGMLDQIKKLSSEPKGEFNFKGKLFGENIRDTYLAWNPQKSRFPVLRGLIDINGKIRFNNFDHTNGQIAITTQDITVDHFKFGNAHITSIIQDNQLEFEQIKIEHPAGLAELKNVRIEQKSPFNFQTDIDLKEFDLQKLFISLGQTKVPASLNSSGQVSCQGQLTSGLSINCKGKIDASDVWVKPAMNDSFYIVKIPKAELSGNAHITEGKVVFDSKIALPNSTGEAEGEVDFEKGFKIDFMTDHLDMNDIEDLAKLNMRGILKLKGNTYGTLNFGKIDAQISATDLEIDKFQLGFLTSNLRYDKMKLFLEDIVGKLNETSYAGQIQFNFERSNLLGLFKMFHIEGEDIVQALNKRFEIPFAMYGKGQAEIVVSGPFDFWKLKYDLKTQLIRGEIANESFENLSLHLIADGKHIQLMKAELKKPQGLLQATGFIQTDPKQLFDIRFKTSQLTVEEIDHLGKLFPNMNGLVSFDGEVHGPVLNPTVRTLFNAKKINFDGIDYSDSSGEISINKKELLMRGQIIGRQIQADLKWPWNINDDYYIKTQLRDLSLFSFLPALSLPMPPSDYYSRLSGEIDIKGNKRTINATSGYAKLNDLVLQRGSHILKLNHQPQLIFENGIKKADTLYLSGEGNSLTVKPQFKNNDVQFYVEADLQLRLFQFLAPFLESLSGQLNVNTSLNFASGQLQMLGEGAISNTYIKLKGFPVPIEEIETPIQFSQSKIIFDEITALIGTRDLNGSGFIDFKGSKNILVDLTAAAENLEITFPEKVTTNGKADLRFSGHWMPYTLKVDYKVNDGLVEKDFGQDENSGVTLLPMSLYLPQSQIVERTPSVMLDVNVDLTSGVVVKNQLVKGEAKGQLNISGTPEQPQMVGRIEIEKGGQLFFRDKPFIIDNAVINFTPAREINPNIYITANSRVAEYDINLLVQGSSKNVQIKPTSQPPLSENDIFSLLALGYTTRGDQTLSSEMQQRQAGIEALATITNQSQFNKKIQNTFGLTVQLAPSIDSTKNIAIPKVVVSKQLQKKLNASYSRPLSGDNLVNEFKLQYLFNPNFSVNLNYQNSERNQQENIQNYNQNESGILGSDVEYKLEFK